MQNLALPWNDFNSSWVFPPGGASSRGLWLLSSLRLTSAPNSNNSDTCSAQSCLTAACRGLSLPLPAFTLAPGSKNSTIFKKRSGDICLQGNMANETSLYAAGPLSRLPVRADSWCREESPGETIHSLDQLHETTGTSHTCYCLHTHTQFNFGGLTIPLQLVGHILT